MSTAIACFPSETPTGKTLNNNFSSDYEEFLAAIQSPLVMNIKEVENFYSQFSVHELLGKGMSSVVRKCSHVSGQGTAMALKIIDLHSELSDNQLRQDARKEIQILHEVRNSPSVLHFEGAWESEGFIFIMTELCLFGDLFNYLSDNPHMPEERIFNIMRQIFDALIFIHSRGIVHRDIKLENVLLSSISPFSIKLADFGLAAWTDSDVDLTEVVGTPSYFAPEMIKIAYDLDDSCVGYGRPIDIWAAGVMMFILLTGQEPFRHRLLRHRRRKLLSGEYDQDSPEWEHVNDSCKHMISQMLNVIPSERPTASTMLEDMPNLDHEFGREVSSSHPTKQLTRRTFRVVVICVIAANRIRKLTFQSINVERLLTNPLSNKMICRWINTASTYLYGHWVTRETGMQELVQNEPVSSIPLHQDQHPKSEKVF